MAINVSTKPTKSTLEIKERKIEDLTEKYSSPLVNYVESNRIDGVDYTRFYTEVDTNLVVGERVYLVNGNYDTFDIIEINKYRKGTNGYVILEIDRCSITLDIEYDGTLPWDTDDFDNYIKVYGCSDTQRTQYEVTQNGYYPYKYMYGYRANNNILYCSTVNQFRVADAYTDVSDFTNWVDITSGFTTNIFPTLSGKTFTTNNGKVLIMDDLEYNGTLYEKGYVYIFENGEWIKDNKSRRSYLSKGNFRDGRFLDGKWNDGIFGQIDKEIDWTGSTWRNGIFFNGNWKNGTMGSKSDSISRQSYYSFLENNLIKQTTDFNNNSGFGYNFVDDSNFESLTANNMVANNCIFGSYSATYSLMRRHLEGVTSFGFGVNLKNGRYIDTKVENALISNGTFEYSDIENSQSLDGRYVDTNIKYSVVAGDYEGIGSIPVLGYQKLITSEEFLYDNPYVSATYSGLTTSLVINHKFYISESNFQKVKAGNWINFNQLVTDNPNILNFLDNSFYLGTDKNGDLYLADNYGDRANVTIQLKSKQQNSKLRILPDTNVFPNFVETTVLNPRSSIDLYVHVQSVASNTNDTLNSYRNNQLIDINYRQSVTEFNDARIQISNIEKTIYNGGTWEASKVNNPDFQIQRVVGTGGNFGDYLSMTFSGGNLEVELKDFTNIFYPDLLKVDDVIAIDNISYDIGGSIYEVDGLYTLATFSETPLTLTLADLGSQSIAGSYSSGGNFISTFIVDNGVYNITDSQDIFNSIHLEKIENTSINQGFIKREFFESNTITNDSFVPQTELDIRNVNLLKISEMLLDSSNDLTVESGLFIRTFIKDTEWNNGIIYRSVVKDLTVNDGVVLQSKWITGTFSGGIFLDARKDSISDPSDTTLQFATNQVNSEWDNGEFTGGEFFDSIWDNGNFHNGDFYNSIFAAGNWYGGDFGDNRYANENSQFGHPRWTHESVNLMGSGIPTWYGGKFINGEFGLRSSYLDGTQSVPSPSIGTISWFDGTFNDGNMLSYTSSTPVVWHDGTFNNGDIIGYVNWKDGTFNQGKFRSSWGDGYGVTSSDYAWEDGIFNGGRFGENSGEIVVNLDGTATYNNPSWFNGRFNDGFFYGKVWNDGIFTGGRFVGNEFSTFGKSYYERFSSEIELPNRTRGISRVNVLVDGDLGTYIIDRYPGTLLHSNPPSDVPQTSQVELGSSFPNSSTPFALSFYEDWVSVTSYDNPTGTYSGITGIDIPRDFVTSSIDYLHSPNIEDEVESIEISYEVSGSGESFRANNLLTMDLYDSDGVSIQSSIVKTISISTGKPSTTITERGILKFVPNNTLPSNFTFRLFDTVSGGVGLPGVFPIGSNTYGELTEYSFKIDDIRINTNITDKNALVPDKFVMDYSIQSTVPYFGLWRNGKVISDNTISVAKSNFLKLSKLESVRKFKGETSPKVFFENALWVDGEFDSFGQMDNCVWLDGSFKNGKFLNSSFNPYVPRWDFSLTGGGTGLGLPLRHPSVGFYQYALTQSCIWKSGYLDQSEFSMSEWLGGVFNSGDMINGHFKQGVANYINAYNCIWEGGTWKNGNWYGANVPSGQVFRNHNGATNLSMPISNITDNFIINAYRYENLSGTASHDLFVWNVVDSSLLYTYLKVPIAYTWYDDLTTSNIASTFINNDYMTFGRLSESYISKLFWDDSNPDTLIENRINDLNFDNGRYGHELDVSYMTLPTRRIVDSISTDGALVTAYWGNGGFIEGVWENGVWNNGIRTDEVFNTPSVNVIMDEVSNFFQTDRNKWQIDIKGFESISNFSAGDYISIGNIIGLTINGDRKFLKDSYQIIKIDNINNIISVVIRTPFPLRAIEKDSENHKISVTKNVWENGKFHNGKFEGVWNSGTFEGYPYISVMQDTYWIDGKFDGGRFISNEVQDSFGFSYSTGLIQNATINVKNTFDDDEFETWMDLKFNDDSNASYIWSNNASTPPSPIPTSDDVLSSDVNLWVGSTNNTLSAREFVNLKMGNKIKSFDELIQDDLDDIYPGETLESRGWSFSKSGDIHGITRIPLPSTQSKFLGYNYGDPYPSDNMSIDLRKSPTFSGGDIFSAEDKYMIGHDNITNLPKNRYWEVSYDVVNIGTFYNDAYIQPYPNGKSVTIPYIENTVKAYHWNFKSDTPIISVGMTAVANIDNITFTEVDYIPFANYYGSSYDITDDLKTPKYSSSDELEYSERDSRFIDNKSRSK